MSLLSIYEQLYKLPPTKKKIKASQKLCKKNRHFEFYTKGRLDIEKI
jgi:hypothetical protein